MKVIKIEIEPPFHQSL